MNLTLRIFLSVCLLIFLVIIFYFLSRKKLNIKYTLIWLFADIGMLVVVAFPKLVDIIGDIIGIASPVNTVFLFVCIFILLIILTLTIIVSHMNSRVCRLVQTQAILEKKIRQLEDK